MMLRQFTYSPEINYLHFNVHQVLSYGMLVTNVLLTSFKVQTSIHFRLAGVDVFGRD